MTIRDVDPIGSYQAGRDEVFYGKESTTLDDPRVRAELKKWGITDPKGQFGEMRKKALLRYQSRNIGTSTYRSYSEQRRVGLLGGSSTSSSFGNEASTRRSVNRWGYLQGIQVYTGHGGSWGGGLGGAYRPGFTAGLTLGLVGNPLGMEVGHKILAMPLNLDAHHLGNGIWSLGFEPSLRLDFLVANLDAGLKIASLSGNGDSGLGLTPFGRVGFSADLFNLEGGALALSNHPGVSAGRGYFMFNLNLAWIMGAIVRGASMANSVSQ